MALMRKISRKHGFRVLLHEKPFKGVNGSGKHNNWSLGTDTGILLMGPGKTPEDNLRFVTFVVNVLKAVYTPQRIAEGQHLQCDQRPSSGSERSTSSDHLQLPRYTVVARFWNIWKTANRKISMLAGKQGMKLDIARIPELLIDNTDRNRTSPFAFTGNRFEFRAVGSEANCASAMLALNAAVAEQLKTFKTEVDAKIADRQGYSSPPSSKYSAKTSRNARRSISTATATVTNGKPKQPVVAWTARQACR